VPVQHARAPDAAPLHSTALVKHQPFGISLQNIKSRRKVKILDKTLIALSLVSAMLASCNSFLSTPTTRPTDMMEPDVSTVGPAVTEVQGAIPTAPPIPLTTATPINPAALLPSPTPLLFTDPSIPMSERIVYYYFVTAAENPHPEGSVMVLPDVYILAPTWSDSTYGSDTAADLRTALEAVLKDSRNGWISSHVDIVQVTFGDGHADVVLQGEYYGVGDVTLIAARMQILMTLFANNSVQTATVTLNGDTIGNLGVSNSINARPANYVFTRAEIEAFMNEPPDGSP
jgi:hypothetical protein